MADQNLSANSSLAICVVDADGFFISSSAGHARRVGRTIEGVVGHTWREWSVPGERDRDEASFAQVVSGQPHGSIVRAVRTDGFLTESRLSMMPAVAPDGQRIVIGIHSAIRIPDRATIRAIQEQTLDAAAYVSDLARELSELAARTGLPRLADSLEAVAGEAGAIMIEAQARRRPN